VRRGDGGLAQATGVATHEPLEVGAPAPKGLTIATAAVLFDRSRGDPCANQDSRKITYYPAELFCGKSEVAGQRVVETMTHREGESRSKTLHERSVAGPLTGHYLGPRNATSMHLRIERHAPYTRSEYLG
jgi:hypothetical protein